MDAILSIGRNNRPNAVLRRAAAQRAGLIQDVTEDDNDEGDRVDTGRGGIAADSHYSKAEARTSIGPKCVICRSRPSPYTCPQCNIPYCSLTCFRAEKHAACAGKFAQHMMKSDQEDVGSETRRGASSGKMAPRADEAERQKMLDVLHRMQRMGGFGNDDEDKQEDDGQMEHGDAEVSDDDMEVDVRAHALRAGVDLDTASTDELLALLSAEERVRFEAMIRDDTKAHGKGASSALAKLLGQSRRADENETAWWRQDHLVSDEGHIETSAPNVTKHFEDTTTKLRHAIDVDRAPAQLEWNIVALMLAYVYVVRHLDIRNLREAHIGEQAMARAIFARLTPYLVTAEDTGHKERQAEGVEDVSRTLLGSAEEATIWIVARLGGDVGREPASMMRFLNDEMLWIVNRESSKVVIMGEADRDSGDTTRHHPEQRLFCDVSSILSSKASQRKVAFYAAYWARLIEAKERRDTVISAIQAEVQRLGAEMKRTEDEERWRAAHDMIQQSGSIVLPA